MYCAVLWSHAMVAWGRPPFALYVAVMFLPMRCRVLLHVTRIHDEQGMMEYTTRDQCGHPI
jgi:hypothetical protein